MIYIWNNENTEEDLEDENLKDENLKVYLDNCCYNRPYDDQSQLRISLETQAKLQIQGMIRDNEITMDSSYVLLYENSRNPHASRQKTIREFVKDNSLFAFVLLMIE